MWIWTLIVATDRYPIRFYFRESIQVCLHDLAHAVRLQPAHDESTWMSLGVPPAGITP